MTCQIISGAIVCNLGTTEHAIRDYRGKTWHFDFSEQFGPLLLTPNERRVSDQQPDESGKFKPFWHAFNKWNAQRLDEAAAQGAKP